MSAPSDRKSLIVVLSVLTFIVCGTYLLSVLGRGYRLNLTSQPRLEATGLLSLVSTPKAASVYIDDHLTTATDDTVNLLPGQYHLKISKDGFLPWSKTVEINRELVTVADVYLYRLAPDLKPITVSGAINFTVSPNGTRMVYAVASASAERENGLFLLETGDNPLNLNRYQTRRLSAPLPGIDWTQFTFKFSPDSNEILAVSPNNNYLFTLTGPNTTDQVFDVTTQLNLISSRWNTQETRIVSQNLLRLPPFIKPLTASSSAAQVQISTSGDQILYQSATSSALVNPTRSPVPTSALSTNTLTLNGYYVYDLNTGNNFEINLGNYTKFFWLNNTTNLILVKTGEIAVMDSDGTNLHPLFKGSFTADQVSQSADGSQLIVLASPYPGAPTNLYAISIR
ncbi:MAG: PEGA domain-containing protein [Candidatus Shapirobacteria bacterium]